MKLSDEKITQMASAAGFVIGKAEIISSDPFVTDRIKDIAQAAYAAGMDAEATRQFEQGTVSIGHMREQIAKEREACAKVCESAAQKCLEAQKGDPSDLSNLFLRHHAVAGNSDAAAIRTRNEQ